jgi:UDP-glucose 4-epimerase
MKVLITGAAGSLGKKLVAKLVENSSIEVFATDIKPNPFLELKSASSTENLNYQTFDLRHQNFTDWLFEIRPDRIIHLASILQISERMTREQAHDIDVKATKRLLENCLKINAEKFIITTSGAAYGYYPENKNIISENRPTRGNEDYFYSAHKAEVEQLMANFRQLHPKLKQVVFRPGAILGPDFEGPVVNLFKQKMITGLIGYPGPFNFIWSEDVVDYIIEALTTDITGEFNIAGEGVLTMKEIAQYLKKPYLALPAWLIQAVLSIAKPLGLTQYGPEQVKFIKFRPVLSNKKLKKHFNHQARYTTTQALTAYLKSTKELQ